MPKTINCFSLYTFYCLSSVPLYSFGLSSCHCRLWVYRPWLNNNWTQTLCVISEEPREEKGSQWGGSSLEASQRKWELSCKESGFRLGGIGVESRISTEEKRQRKRQIKFQVDKLYKLKSTFRTLRIQYKRLPLWYQDLKRFFYTSQKNHKPYKELCVTCFKIKNNPNTNMHLE